MRLNLHLTYHRRKSEMIPTRHEPDQTSLGGAGPAVVVAGCPARPVCRFRHACSPLRLPRAVKSFRAAQRLSAESRHLKCSGPV